MSTVERYVCRDAAHLAAAAAERFIEVANGAVEQQGRAIVALAGGHTPGNLYDRLALHEVRGRIPWSDIQWFWGDERAVPPDHPDSNYRLAVETSLGKSGIDAIHVHRMPADAPKRDIAAAAYERLILATLGDRPDGSTFDLVLLGVGEDGHTASLFPGAPELDERARLVVATEQPYLEHYRMTLTYPAINRAREVLILVSGAAKAEAVQRAMSPDADPRETPVAGVRPKLGRLAWFADRDALTSCGTDGWTPVD